MNKDEWLHRLGIDAWRQMVTVREFDGRLGTYTARGLIKGATHSAVGMEAVAAGVSVHLRIDDVIASTHRGHAHCLAKGADAGRLLAELFGRSGGYCGGRGGSMHIAARELGILGTTAIVGAGIGLATGAALAFRLEGSDKAAVSYFGDGAINQGLFHESLNLAAIWKLPCVYVCENNQYAQSSKVTEMTSIANLASRGQAYGIPGVDVDGMDGYAMSCAAEEALARARGGHGPSLIVAETYRYSGHAVSDTERYRTADEIELWKTRDPIAALESDLLSARVCSAEELVERRRDVVESMDRSEEFALASPPPVRATTTPVEV